MHQYGSIVDGDWHSKDVPCAVSLKNQLINVYYANEDSLLTCRRFAGTRFNGAALLDQFGCRSPGAGILQGTPYVAFEHFDGSHMRIMRWDGSPSSSNTPDNVVIQYHVGSSGIPAIADMLGKPTIVHQGSGDNGETWYIRANGGQTGSFTWSDDTILPHTGMSGSPSIFSDSSGYYSWIFHEGGNNNGELWCNGWTSANEWTGDIKVNIPYPIKSPKVVLYLGRPLLIWQGAKDWLFFAYLKRSHLDWSIDGSTILEQKIDFTVAEYGFTAAVAQDTVYVFARIAESAIYRCWFGE
ncbi:hypothetical protein QCD58_005015 [Enterobacter hormaechei]|nr:hypothetical protein [Enterobacter hormaechei]